jgi:hypothetical protein
MQPSFKNKKESEKMSEPSIKHDDKSVTQYSGSSNNNNEKSSVINTVIQYNEKLLQHLRLVKTFSITPEKIPIYKEFCRIAEREAGPRGFSEVLLKAMEEYVKRHSIPNPQTTLNRTLELGIPAKRYDMCSVPNCKRKAAYQKTLRNYNGKTEVFNVCENHKKWRHPDYPFIVSFKTL